MDDESRLQHIDSALRTRNVQEQFGAWKAQRDLLRSTVTEIYDDGKEWNRWWTSCKEDVKTALVITALEDLPNSPSFSSLAHLVCPELDVSVILEEEGGKVQEILANVVSERENHEEVFNFTDLFQAMKDSIGSDGPTSFST
eukprot:TRINITY_DN10477_c0_g1_i1.p1 TRINITY_DN10477_c0_g1~~TRINITY_DN10477_c0_g1_i1.p1  ORF type:complete len:159 (-),score=15.03 TRINITY_DN10477_c0_g1_i1:144-569(-)